MPLENEDGMNASRVTASMLYNLLTCEHRPWMDLYAKPDLRDPVSPFVEMLWRRGVAHEEEAVAESGQQMLDISRYPIEEREARTLEAMGISVPLIYSGRIASDDLLGVPDLLRVEGSKYIPGDIKSGAAEEGPGDNRKPKERYAVQLALYVDVLERLDLSAGRRGFIWDVHGDDVTYDLTAPKGEKTTQSFWNDYEECLAMARDILAGKRDSSP